MERRWGSDLTVFVAPPTVAGAVPWWLLLLSSAYLWSLVPEVQHGEKPPSVRAIIARWAERVAAERAAAAVRSGGTDAAASGLLPGLSK